MGQFVSHARGIVAHAEASFYPYRFVRLRHLLNNVKLINNDARLGRAACFKDRKQLKSDIIAFIHSKNKEDESVYKHLEINSVSYLGRNNSDGRWLQ